MTRLNWEFLRSLLKQRGVSQAELARAVRIDETEQIALVVAANLPH